MRFDQPSTEPKLHLRHLPLASLCLFPLLEEYICTQQALILKDKILCAMDHNYLYHYSALARYLVKSAHLKASLNVFMVDF